MPKTCRTCDALQGYCHAAGILPLCGGAFSCGLWSKRETPLLVDALGDAAQLLLQKMDNIGDGMLFNLDILDARELLRKAVARYKKEEGDDSR